jgi:hypothetical protein
MVNMKLEFKQSGTVLVDNRKIDVLFHFVDDATIICKDKNNFSFTFYTHYKSLEIL